MREIKIRAWDNVNKELLDGEFFEVESKLKSHEDVVYKHFANRQDKNGIDIYEGDIVRADGKIYEGKELKFNFFGLKNKENYCLFDDFNEIEIIGNIFENPKLLGVNNA